MSNDPYRPQATAESNDELTRLAQVGRRRIEAAAHGQSQTRLVDGNRNLRTAVGAVRGSTIKRALLVFLVLSLATFLSGVTLLLSTHDTAYFPMLQLGCAVSVISGMTFVVVPPLASRGAMEAERAWVAALPFALEGYFEVLSAEPSSTCQLKLELSWQSLGPDPATLQGVVGVLDTDARVTQSSAEAATIVSGSVSGTTAVRVNRMPVCRNHRVARYLHRMVDTALVPVHRNRPIARVSVSRS